MFRSVPCSLDDLPLLFRVLLERMGPDCVRLVGGYVRDMVRGAPCSDIDICVCVSIEVLVDVLNQIDGLRYHVGPDNGHQTVYVRYRHVSYDVTSCYIADVRIDECYRLDWMRRDFTINAMSISLRDNQCVLHDGGRGYYDTMNGVISPCTESCYDDSPIRVLRYYRFSMMFPDTLHPELPTRDLSSCYGSRVERELYLILSHARYMSVLGVVSSLLGLRVHFSCLPDNYCGPLRFYLCDLADVRRVCGMNKRRDSVIELVQALLCSQMSVDDSKRYIGETLYGLYPRERGRVLSGVRADILRDTCDVMGWSTDMVIPKTLGVDAS